MKQTLLVVLCFSVMKLFAQQNQKSTLILESGENLKSIESIRIPSQEKSTLCRDTLRYAEAKESILGDGNWYSGFSVWEEDDELVYMSYINSGSVNIHGVEFYGANSVSGTITVRASIYNVDASLKPTTSIASVNLNVTSTTYGYKYATFSTPVTVTGNYAVVLDVVTTGGVLNLYINDQDLNAYDENLSGFYSSYAGYPNPNNWNTMLEFSEGLYNYEPLMAPIVSYNINTSYAVTPLSACVGQEVLFQNTSVYPQLNNRMFSYEAFRTYFGLSTVDSSYIYDLGLDLNPAVISAADLVWSNGNITHTYTAAGSYSTNLITLGGFWNGCQDYATINVTVNATPNASFSYGTATVCAGGSELVPTSVTTSGGTFSANNGLGIDAATGAIDIEHATDGTYTITYEVGVDCPTSSTQTLTISAAPSAAFEYENAIVCSSSANLTPVFTTGSAGEFSATPSLDINSITGEINLANAQAGTYIITNTIAASGACAADEQTFELTIVEAVVADFDYDVTAICSNGTSPVVTINGATGGVFSATSGLEINGETGVIDVAASTVGNHVVTYIVDGGSVCQNDTATVNITITEMPTADFTYEETTFCATGTATPTISGATGTFTSTTGLTINASTGVINLGSSTAGTYTITNTIAAAAGCQAVSEEATITITALPEASVTVANKTAAAAEVPGATFQWVDCSTNTEIAGATNSTYSPSTPGTFKVVVTLDGCSATSTCVTIDNLAAEGLDMQNVVVYPNPASEFITIDGLNATAASITITDVNGKLIYSEVTSSNQVAISVATFETGVYFINIVSDKIIGTSRFVKK